MICFWYSWVFAAAKVGCLVTSCETVLFFLSQLLRVQHIWFVTQQCNTLWQNSPNPRCTLEVSKICHRIQSPHIGSSSSNFLHFSSINTIMNHKRVFNVPTFYFAMLFFLVEFTWIGLISMYKNRWEIENTEKKNLLENEIFFSILSYSIKFVYNHTSSDLSARFVKIGSRYSFLRWLM